ncbi:MAG: hypothetical protein QOC76_1272 [Mycobacterium sp.]|nr:hypothetical protein [Mycobacterium sp.]
MIRDQSVGAHNDLHSDRGARKDEHPGRSRGPIIKVHDIAWLEFEKPDLARAEAFSQAFAPGRESLRELRKVISALRTDNDFDLTSLRGLLAVANS